MLFIKFTQVKVYQDYVHLAIKPYVFLDSHGSRLKAMTPFLKSDGKAFFFFFNYKRKSNIYVAYRDQMHAYLAMVLLTFRWHELLSHAFSLFLPYIPTSRSTKNGNTSLAYLFALIRNSFSSANEVLTYNNALPREKCLRTTVFVSLYHYEVRNA